MNKGAAKSIDWYRVIIDDPQLATSASFRVLLGTVMRNVPSSVVKVMGLEVVSISATELLIPYGAVHVLSIDALLDALRSITQLVWGRFFLFENEAAAVKADERDLAECIAASKTTVCVVDNSSYFVFTKSASLVHELLEANQRLEVIKDDLSRIMARSGDF